MVRAELCGTAAEGKKVTFSSPVEEKERVHERPKRCLVVYCKFIASEYCETLQAGLNPQR